MSNAPVSQRDFASSWRDIDAPGDTQPFVRFMDTLNSFAWFKERKHRAIDLLEIKPGFRILEVGCGTGEESRAMGQLVGPSGHITAVDISQAMLDVASARTQPLGLPVTFELGDAHHLDYPAESFDGSYCLSTLEIVKDPRGVVAELVRLTRPGGRVVVSATDAETYVASSPDRPLTRRILNHFCDHVLNGWTGRNLLGLLREFGLADVTVFPSPSIFTDFPLAREFFLNSMADSARESGAVSAAEATAWLEGLAQVDQAGGFVLASLTFVAGGRKP